MNDPALSVFDMGLPAPCPERFNMASYALGAAVTDPGKIALRVISQPDGQPEDWSFGALDRAVRCLAGHLISAGLKPGDRVALRLGNTTAFPIFFFGTIAAGGVAVPTSTLLTERELAVVCGDMAPKFVAVSRELSREVPPGPTLLPESLAFEEGSAISDYADTGPNDPAFLIYTSGASGTPKGVLHAQRSAWARRMMWSDWYGLTSNDVMLHAGAFNWTYTLGTGLTDPWAAGAATIVYTGSREPDIWPKLAERFSPTLFAAVPGVYRQILKSDLPLEQSFQSLRHGLTAGEKLPETLRETWEKRTSCRLYEALGMSEISTYVSQRPGRPRVNKSCGRPQTGRRVAVLDPETFVPVPMGLPGLLAVSRRDPGLMLGYWGRADLAENAFQGEWFLTGDRAQMNINGDIEFLGRADDLMTSLGYRVSPIEVEEALIGHPNIAELCVAELPVRKDISLIAAFIQSRGSLPKDEHLEEYAVQRLARYKIPRIWIEVPDLPRTANGKLLRRELIEAHRRDR